MLRASFSTRRASSSSAVSTRARKARALFEHSPSLFFVLAVSDAPLGEAGPPVAREMLLETAVARDTHMRRDCYLSLEMRLGGGRRRMGKRRALRQAAGNRNLFQAASWHERRGVHPRGSAPPLPHLLERALPSARSLASAPLASAVLSSVAESARASASRLCCAACSLAACLAPLPAKRGRTKRHRRREIWTEGTCSSRAWLLQRTPVVHPERARIVCAVAAQWNAPLVLWELCAVGNVERREPVISREFLEGDCDQPATRSRRLFLLCSPPLSPVSPIASPCLSATNPSLIT